MPTLGVLLFQASSHNASLIGTIPPSDRSGRGDIMHNKYIQFGSGLDIDPTLQLNGSLCYGLTSKRKCELHMFKCVGVGLGNI